MAAIAQLSTISSLSTATNYAEKWNQVSENKLQLTFEELDAQRVLTTAKINRDMMEIKDELTKLKRTKPNKPSRAANKKRADGNKNEAKPSKASEKKAESSEESQSSDEENVEPTKRRTKSSDCTYAKRSENKRLVNLHRRYSAQLTADLATDVLQKLAKAS